MAENLTPIEQNTETISEIKTLVDELPEKGEAEKSWTKIIDLEITEATATIEKTELDNCTDVYIAWNALCNETSTESGYNLFINDIMIVQNTAAPITKSGAALKHGFTISKYNGLVWETYQCTGASTKGNKQMSAAAIVPFALIEGVGRMTKFKLSCPSTPNVAISGTLEVWVR